MALSDAKIVLRLELGAGPGEYKASNYASEDENNDHPVSSMVPQYVSDPCHEYSPKMQLAK